MVSASGSRPFPPGVHVPSLTWFDDGQTQEIAWDVQTKHIEFLVNSGLHGIVVAGTNGEAVTLTREEKHKLVSTTRDIATRLGRPDITITLGCGGSSTREVIAETQLAAEAGADFALVLVPSYFHFAMDQAAIVSFFEELASASPVPVVIYNFPGVVAGLDVNSEMLSKLGKHPNIVGVKLTCGGIAKVARIAAEFDPQQFCALAGQSDWLVPAMSVGGTGTITGIANLYPKVCLEIYDLWNQGKIKDASALQLKLAQMEWGFGKGGINGTKWVVAKLQGYPIEKCHCRRPYPEYSDAEKQEWIYGVCAPLGEEEARLAKNS
ncbi:dihydrodipicolinate synthetase [Microdochium trichocladiopsis]|uniref:Dihydrodipicolinate synthetase n=1 Tax=Microdochium trichocladiopsis TaxID=1682393 RepID=A0A9P8Y5V5_9PEZI|nr:dihydrodipicolinate synthetase [Microdochium trichocladiopsis]KAH7029885.1 dihydrodipicolinate synthetase [Microdochium trichocladiopsis]